MKRRHWLWWGAGLLGIGALIALALPRHLVGRRAGQPSTPSAPTPLSQRKAGTPQDARSAILRDTSGVIDDYLVRVAPIKLIKRQPRVALVAVECRTQDGKPLPHNLTFDTRVVDNQCKWHNVGSTYESYGRDGKALSSHSRQRAYAMRQTLRLGPLGEQVHWFDISVTIYKQVPVEKRRATFRLITVATADLGRHTVAPASTAVPPRIIRLAGHALPVYPGATTVTVSGAQTSFATAYYEVPGLRYPCMDVLRFYEAWTSKHGWERVGARSSKWDQFADDTLRGAPMVFQMIGRWKRKACGDELRVVCRYYLPGKWWGGYVEDDTQKWAQDQTVHLSLRLAASAAAAPRKSVR